MRFGGETASDANFEKISKGPLGLRIGYSLSTGFQIYLFKCWDPYVTPGFMRWLDFFWVFLPCLSTMVLSLLALGLHSMYIGQGSRIQFVWIWISFLDSLFFSWLIVWVDGINKCDWCPGGSTGWWLNGLHQIPKVSWLFHHSLHFNIYYILSIVPGMQCHMYYYYQWWCWCMCVFVWRGDLISVRVCGVCCRVSFLCICILFSLVFSPFI